MNPSRRQFLSSVTVAPAAVASALATAAAADPLLDAIKRYRSGVVALNSVPVGLITLENEDDIVEETYGPHYRRLLEWDEPALTRESAVEALRLMESEQVFLDDIGISMHRAVLRYLESL
jgi:hypothetical protein